MAFFIEILAKTNIQVAIIPTYNRISKKTRYILSARTFKISMNIFSKF